MTERMGAPQSILDGWNTSGIPEEIANTLMSEKADKIAKRTKRALNTDEHLVGRLVGVVVEVRLSSAVIYLVFKDDEKNGTKRQLWMQLNPYTYGKLPSQYPEFSKDDPFEFTGPKNIQCAIGLELSRKKEVPCNVINADKIIEHTDCIIEYPGPGRRIVVYKRCDNDPMVTLHSQQQTLSIMNLHSA
ncbi:MAG: hypothetical protein M3P33_04500 [bacterium]|nr:hypothetical protein [bacterium]